jgi:hypothetical protein
MDDDYFCGSCKAVVELVAIWFLYKKFGPWVALLMWPVVRLVCFFLLPIAMAIVLLIMHFYQE